MKVLKKIITFIVAGLIGFFMGIIVCNKTEQINNDYVFIPYEKEIIPKIEHIEGMTTNTFCELPVDIILQYPELPTGCEVTCLTMALNYHGYDISKTDLVDEYLLYRTDDYQVGFGGSPYSENGSSMWPPAIVDMINSFMEDNGDIRKGVDKTGTSLDSLLKCIDEGSPIIVWVNEDFSTEIVYDNVELYYNNHTYKSYWNEHCVLIKGYDLDKNVVIINNPLIGEQEIDKDLFEEVYNICGKYAVVIDLI